MDANKASLALVGGKDDIDALAALFERLTGRKPSQQELADALTELHREGDESSTADAAELPDAHFGKHGGKVDWRAQDDGAPDDDDDEELPQSPEDVVAMLGFDPLELNGADE